MSQKPDNTTALPDGWDMAQDVDGKCYFIDHNNKVTTWVDPRDSYCKPRSFSDCSGDELPLGWETVYDNNVGVYFVNHITKSTQLEDPRERWRHVQQCMLHNYLASAEQQLQARRELFSLKQQRLLTAQQEYSHLTATADQLTGSKWSVCSHSSYGSNGSGGCGGLQLDNEQLKAEVAAARTRVHSLRHDVQRMRCDVALHERGIESLTTYQGQVMWRDYLQPMMTKQSLMSHEWAHQTAEPSVERRTSDAAAPQLVHASLPPPPPPCSLAEAQAIVDELANIERSLGEGELEKRQLLCCVSRLQHDHTPTATSPCASVPSSPTPAVWPSSSSLAPLTLSTEFAEPMCAADLHCSVNERLAGLSQLRVQYEESRRLLLSVQQQLAQVDRQLQPHLVQTDKDRLLLIQEKEEYIRELQHTVSKYSSDVDNADLKPYTGEHLAQLQAKITQLRADVQNAHENNNRTIAERLRMHERRHSLLSRLRDLMSRTNQLETRLRARADCLSCSSSGAGSLTSLASSRSSLNGGGGGVTHQACGLSPSLMPARLPSATSVVPVSRGVDMADLQRRVERLLLSQTCGDSGSVGDVSSGAASSCVEPPLAATAAAAQLTMSPIIEVVNEPPFSKAAAAVVAVSPGGIASSVSSESVTGDSGVFELAATAATAAAATAVSPASGECRSRRSSCRLAVPLYCSSGDGGVSTAVRASGGCVPPRCAAPAHSTGVRRSQTFSPSVIDTGALSSYVCRLNRSDSDSAIPAARSGGGGSGGPPSFQRGAIERRSLRRKMPPPPSPMLLRGRAARSSGRGCFVARNSLHLQGELQVQQARLRQMQDELSELRALKARLENERRSAAASSCRSSQGTCALIADVTDVGLVVTPSFVSRGSCDVIPSSSSVAAVTSPTTSRVSSAASLSCASSIDSLQGSDTSTSLDECCLLTTCQLACDRALSEDMNGQPPTPGSSSNRSTLTRDQTAWQSDPAAGAVATSEPSMGELAMTRSSRDGGTAARMLTHRFSYVYDPELGVQV